MFSKLRVASFILFSILSLSAAAREAVPVVNYEALEITTSNGNKPDVAKVEQAIKTAAIANNWTLSTDTDGTLLATLVVRNKHTIVVTIPFDSSKFGLLYKNSINMKYEMRDGKPVIHPFYNKWVDVLKEAIRLELLKL
jgi:hypothetical protein